MDLAKYPQPSTEIHDRPEVVLSDFESSWPQTSELGPLQDHFNEGLTVLRNRLSTPSDQRMEVVVGLTSMGGPDAAPATLGESGTGKTALGLEIYGPGNIIEITSTHTAEKLLGHPNVINPDQYVPGDIDPDDPSDAIAFLNEFNHMSNTGPLHVLWDDETLTLGGREINLADMSIYLAMNFPDGNRTHQPDKAALSRMAAVILTGDGGRDFTQEIRAIDLADIYSEQKQQDIERQKRREQGLPDVMPVRLLPPANIRRVLRQEIAINTPLDKSATPENAPSYVDDVIYGLIDSGLIDPPVASDKRIDFGWHSTARAMQLVAGKAHITNSKLTATELMNVAPLGLGSLAYLSRSGTDFFEEVWGGDRLTPMQSAISARWAIGAIAAATKNPEINEKDLHAHLVERSFANIPNPDTREAISAKLYKRVVRNERSNADDGSRAKVPRRRS